MYVCMYVYKRSRNLSPNRMLKFEAMNSIYLNKVRAPSGRLKAKARLKLW